MWPNHYIQKHLYVQSVTNIPVDNLCIVVSNAGKKGKCSLMCHTQIAGAGRGRSNNPFAAFLFSLLYHPASGWGKNLFFLISYSSSSIFYPTRWCCNKHHGPFTFPSRFSTLVIDRFYTNFCGLKNVHEFVIVHYFVELYNNLLKCTIICWIVQ